MNLNDVAQVISEEINKDTNSRLVKMEDATDLQYQALNVSINNQFNRIIELVSGNGSGINESTSDLALTIEGLKEYISATFSANEITSESIASELSDSIQINSESIADHIHVDASDIKVNVDASDIYIDHSEIEVDASQISIDEDSLVQRISVGILKERERVYEEADKLGVDLFKSMDEIQEAIKIQHNSMNAQFNCLMERLEEISVDSFTKREHPVEMERRKLAQEAVTALKQIASKLDNITS